MQKSVNLPMHAPRSSIIMFPSLIIYTDGVEYIRIVELHIMITEKTIDILRQNYHARAHNNDYSKLNLGFGFLHYSFIRNSRPKNILILGSQRGYVPAICALACADEGYGIVDFVDAGYELKDPHAWGGIGIWKTADSRYWEPLGIQDHIILHCETIEKFASKISCKYQYIYIDGDHSYEGVKGNYELLFPFLEEGGYMAFHDVTEDKNTDYGLCGVKKFWEELIARYTGEHITFPFSVGLGILKK